LFLITIAFCTLIAFAIRVQVTHKSFFVEKGELRITKTLDLPANRGAIIDRYGVVLASSVLTPSLWVNPRMVDIKDPKLESLAKLLNLNITTLREKIAAANHRYFIWLKRQINWETAQRVMALQIEGIYQLKEYRRHYPDREATAHILGFTNIENQGQEGIEYLFNKELAGTPGLQQVMRDGRGNIIDNLDSTRLPQNGKQVQLSIDSKIQSFAYQQLRQAVKQNKAKSGSIVVLNAQSGQVLAITNYPSFHAQNRKQLQGYAIRNRAITDVFEPGSTVKPFIVALAIDTGLVTPKTPIYTPGGKIRIKNTTIRDTKPHEVLTVNEIIQKSSNVGVVKIGLQIPPSVMWDFYRQLGFGQKPDILFPGVGGGYLSDYQSWKPIRQATMTYGYGLSVSLLQLAHAYTIFANHGRLLPLSLVHHEKTDIPQGVAVIRSETAKQVRDMLHLVTLKEGTAPKSSTLGYLVGGKTGTVHKQANGRYYRDKYKSLFVGLAPIKNPHLIIAVVIDEPSGDQHYGGDVAAPVFSKVAEYVLQTKNIAPDISTNL
jgi:cell division protein FtsI (penicillin-binding protein 3)